MGWKDESGKIIAAVTTISQKVLDDSIRLNAQNASGAGLEVRVTRVYDDIGVHDRKDPCRWCMDRAGNNMTYQEAYEKGSFERHDGCGCIIEYVSARGVKTYQTGKSSPDNWLSEAEFKRRVNYRLDERTPTPQERIINAAIEMQIRDKKSSTLVDAIIKNHEALKYYTPEAMKRRLERAGYRVTALKKGSLKDKLFEDGGGYVTNFGGDGIFQYHPKDRTHHGDEYWKVQNGKIGEWYDRSGALIRRTVDGKEVFLR